MFFRPKDVKELLEKDVKEVERVEEGINNDIAKLQANIKDVQEAIQKLRSENQTIAEEANSKINDNNDLINAKEQRIRKIVEDIQAAMAKLTEFKTIKSVYEQELQTIEDANSTAQG